MPYVRRYSILLSLTAFGSAVFLTSLFYLVNKQNFIKVQATTENDDQRGADEVLGQPVPFDPVKSLPEMMIEDVFDNEIDVAGDAVVLVTTGDVIPARAVNQVVVSKNDFTWPFQATAAVLKSADITLINLESPLLPKCPITVEGMRFCGDSRHVEGLRFAGVDVASLANNHIGNYGLDGINATVSLLKAADIKVAGISGAEMIEKNGIKFGFLAYNLIGVPEKGVDDAKMASEVSALDAVVDVVVVSMHWGVEYVTQPSRGQRDLAQTLIDNGADLIVGNHPHWIEPVEIYHNRLIVYAHGNFIFDQMWSEKTKEGVVGRYYFDENRLVDAEFLPVVVENYGQPYFVQGERKTQILNEMRYTSLDL